MHKDVHGIVIYKDKGVGERLVTSLQAASRLLDFQIVAKSSKNISYVKNLWNWCYTGQKYSFIGTWPCPFVYLSSLAAFVSDGRAESLRTLWSAKPQVFTVWPWIENNSSPSSLVNYLRPRNERDILITLENSLMITSGERPQNWQEIGKEIHQTVVDFAGHFFE